MFINNWYYKDSSKELHKTDVVMFFITHKFFHNNRPGKPLPGHSSFLGLFWALFLWVWGDGGRDGRTAGGAAAWSCLVRSFRRVILSV